MAEHDELLQSLAAAQLTPDQQLRLLELQQELRLKEQDIALRREELVFQRRKDRVSPLSVALATGVLTLIVALTNNILQERANRELERSKTESALLVKAIETGDHGQAATNLLFLLRIGLISDNTGRIRALERAPGNAPVLPATAGGNVAPPAVVSSLDSLYPSTAAKVRTFIQRAAEAGQPIIVYETTRSPELQAFYYARGRTTPGPTVTNVSSPKNSSHFCRVAFDVISTEKAWDLSEAEWRKIAAIGRSLGFTWGGDWQFRDLPHFEDPSSARPPCKVRNGKVIPPGDSSASDVTAH